MEERERAEQKWSCSPPRTDRRNEEKARMHWPRSNMIMGRLEAEWQQEWRQEWLKPCETTGKLKLQGKVAL